MPHILDVRLHISTWLPYMGIESVNGSEKITLYIRTYHVESLQFPSTSFPIHYSLIVLSYGPVQSELLTLYRVFTNEWCSFKS